VKLGIWVFFSFKKKLGYLMEDKWNQHIGSIYLFMGEKSPKK
jgi:hypothetical protein